MKFYAKVLSFGTIDSSGESFPADATVDFAPKIICSFDGVGPECVGFAELERKEDGVYANIEFVDEIMVGFIKAGAKIYPSVAGGVKERDGKLIKSCVIHQIMVGVGRNSDESIQPLKL